MTTYHLILKKPYPKPQKKVPMLKIPRLIPQQMLLMMSIFCHVASPPRQHDPHHVARPLTLPPPHDSNHVAQPLIKSTFCHVAPPPQQHDPHHVERPLTLPSPHDPNHVAQPLTLLMTTQQTS